MASDIGEETATSSGKITTELDKSWIEALEARIEHLEAKISLTPRKLDQLSIGGDKRVSILLEETSTASPTKTESTEDEKSIIESDRAETKPEPRYKLVISKWSEDKLERYDKPFGNEDRDETIEQDESLETRFAFTFRKVQSSDDASIDYSEIIVESQGLQDLLHEITKDTIFTSRWDTLRSPFPGLLQVWSKAEKEALEVYGESEQSRIARQDLKELLRVISTSSGVEMLDRYFRARPQLVKDKKITFEALFTLFPSGELVIAKPFMGTEQVFFVEQYFTSSAGGQKFKAICCTFDWDGENFQRIPYLMEIAHFDDTKDIAELPFHPLEYYNAEGGLEALRQRLEARGARWRELCIAPRGKQMFTYKGSAYSQKNAGIFRSITSGSTISDSESDVFNGRASIGGVDGSDSTATFARSDVRGTVIVDFQSYYSYQTESAPILGGMYRYTGTQICDCTGCRNDPWKSKTYRFDWDRADRKKKLTHEQALCSPPRVLGYSMDKKKWMQLHVDNVKDWSLTNKNNVFENDLQLDQHYKDLVRKSVKSHETTKGQNRGIDDFAEGKGKGLVILLYGVPGVGKSLTAESVANLARKPLFPVGVSDIGIDGQNVETHLQRVFDLAGLWEAVLLFDEADVFLEARGEGITDLRRNTMVSGISSYLPVFLLLTREVLLRVLEYYEGILILTTNRLRSFDIAVQSRIHIAIKYEDLTEKQREKIFQSFITQLANKKLISDKASIDDWIQTIGKTFDLNGRQIRNIVSTAMGLARADNEDDPKLETKHLSLVATQTTRFQKELASVDAIYRNQQISKMQR
ncbi:MAG: hypothetical protein M1820_009019 [Bogoriella megaspora]|nr:MAG: hypothetical protein M1820_009019 [Bogoriella megaspora]